MQFPILRKYYQPTYRTKVVGNIIIVHIILRWFDQATAPKDGQIISFYSDIYGRDILFKWVLVELMYMCLPCALNWQPSCGPSWFCLLLLAWSSVRPVSAKTWISAGHTASPMQVSHDDAMCHCDVMTWHPQCIYSLCRILIINGW